MDETTWSIFTFDLAKTIRTLIAKIDAILANASPDDIIGLAIWGVLTCSGIHIAVYRSTLYFQAEINRSAPIASPERQHGWEKPPNVTSEVVQLRLYLKQQLANAGYANIEVITLW